MPIRLVCPNGHAIQVRDEFLGKRAKCPKCGAIVAVTAPPEPQVAREAVPVDDDPGYEIVQDDPGHNTADSHPAPNVPVASSPSPEPEAADRPRATRTRSKPRSPRQNWVDVARKPMVVGAAVSCLLLTATVPVLVVMLRGPGPSNPQPVESPAVKGDADSALEPVAQAEPSKPPEVPPPAATPEQPAAPQETIAGTVVKLRSAPAHLAFDHRTGDLAVTDEAGKLHVYRSKFFDGDDTAVGGPIDVDAQAPVLFKMLGEDRLLLVRATDHLLVLDAASLERFDSRGRFPNPLPLGTRATASPADVYMLSTSRDPGDPLVYFNRLSWNYGWLVNLHNSGSIVGLDLQARSEVAPSGRYLFSMSQQATLSLLWPLRLPGSQSKLPPLKTVATNAGNFVLDPFEQLIVSNQGILHADSGQQIAKPAHEPLCVMERRPWIVAEAPTELHFLERETGSDAAQLILPATLRDARAYRAAGSPEPEPGPLRCFDDPAHDRLIVQRGGSAWVVPVAALKLPDHPLLAASVALPPVLEPGKPVSAPIAIPDARVKVSLRSGPEGAAIEDNRLSWTPRRRDAGLVRFTLAYEAGEAKREQEYHCAVAATGPPLPFSLWAVALSEKGTYAAAWNSTYGQSAATPRLCIIDTRTGAIVAERTMPRQVLTVRLTSQQVFVLYDELRGFSRQSEIGHSGCTLDVLRLPDLTLERSIALTRELSRIETCDERLLVFPDSRCINIPDLSDHKITRVLGPIPGDPANFPIGRPDHQFANGRPAPAGWQIGPAVFNADDWSLQFLTTISSNHHPLLAPYGGSLELGWAVPPAAGHVMTRDMAAGNPSAASLRAARQRFGLNLRPDPKFNATYVDLVSARSERPLPIAWLPKDVKRGTVLHAGPTIAIVTDEFLVPLSSDDPELALGDDTMNLRVHPVSAPILLPTKGDHTLRYSIQGGTAPYQFRFTLPRGWEQSRTFEPAMKDAVKTDEKKHSAVLDCSALLAKLKQDYEFTTRALEPLVAGRVGTPNEIVNEYIHDANEYLEPLLKRKARDFPVVVSFFVHVTDANSTRASLCHQMIMEVPRADVVTMITTIQSVRADRAAEQGTSKHAALYAALLKTHAKPMDQSIRYSDVSQAVECSALVRQRWPRTPVADPVVEPIAAMDTVMRRVSNRIGRGDGRNPAEVPVRVWKCADGTTVRGRVAASNAGDVGIQSESGDQLTPLARLDEKGTVQAWSDFNKLTLGNPDNRQYVTQANLKEVGRAIRAFHADYGCFPPQALVSKTGQPLLSWRVLILPYLGHTALFRLFHLDEPWDSPHNRKLIPYVSEYFVTADQPLATGHCNLLGIAASNGAFPAGPLRRAADFLDPGHDTIFAVDVASDAAVEWTRPVDLDVQDKPAAFAQLDRHRDSNFSVEYSWAIFGDGVSEQIPSTTTQPVLMRAATIDDKAPSGYTRRAH